MDSQRSALSDSLTAKAFDNLSDAYDREFTLSDSGRTYRHMVHGYLHQWVLTREGMDILDLNCGTGEDALLLGSAGHHVTALDISHGMIDVARRKCAHLPGVTFAVTDIRDLETQSSQAFDVVLSDFGGLNCFNRAELGSILRQIHRLLRPGGHFIAIVMPAFAWWEFYHFILRGKFGKAFRRVKGHAIVITGGVALDVWYYSPAALSAIAGSQFQPVRFTPLGVFTPPGAVKDTYGMKRALYSLFGKIDRFLWKRSLAAAWGDHFLADFSMVQGKEAGDE